MVNLQFLLILAISVLCKSEIAKAPGQLWTAGVNERFAGMSSEEFRRLFRSDVIELPANIEKFAPPKNLRAPDTFDAGDYWPFCNKTIKYNVRDQGACVSGWAAASAATMSDVTCIKCDGVYSPYLSEQDLLTCCQGCGDCDRGGRCDLAFDFWVKTGLVTGGPQGCLPYTGSHNNCSCESWYPATYNQDKHTGSIYQTVSGVDNMQLALYTFGPLTASNFTVYDDFKDYKSGIYHYVSGAKKGMHAVKIIGYGVDDGTPYWLAVNSFGTKWGMNGLFKIRRGNNECGIETQVISAKASTDACFMVGTTTTTRKSAGRFSPGHAATLILPLILIAKMR